MEACGLIATSNVAVA